MDLGEFHGRSGRIVRRVFAEVSMRNGSGGIRGLAGFLRAASALAALTLASGVASAQLLAASTNGLTSKVVAAIGEHRSLETATIGVHIRDAATGEDLFSRNAQTPLIPASNMKLLTTGAALRVLGPDHVFETRIGWAGDRVVVIGDGDPGFGDPALLDASDPPISVDEMLDTLASAVANAPAAKRRASGVFIDDRVLDRELVHPSWPVDQLNRWYCAEVSGLNFHTNCLSFFFNADRDAGLSVGGSPSVRLQPEIEGVGDWISLRNKAEIVSKGRITTWVARAAGARPANEFTVFGNLRTNASSMVDVAVHDPAVFFGRLLAERLDDKGVAVAKAGGIGARVDRVAEMVGDAGGDAVLAGFEPAAIVRTAMPDVMRRANTNSQNLFTEVLIKRVGHALTREPGSWQNGSAVIRMLLNEDLGPEHATRTTIDDGSGMSRENRVAPGTMTAWLGSLLQRPSVGTAMLDSMPEPGTGTLRRRFKGAELTNAVRAKTGSINGVRCLSGYVLTPDGSQAVAFSVMVNDIEHGSQIRDALDLHEDIVAAIDSWLGEVAPVQRGIDEPAAVGG
jgi:D-alanyl-D-alanine carboxypeptidase/D-alanyl-D-alanine-endopeptidase (penicillin-binding protein 4)